jgi:macrodomain Ter protein organizer (MatP/YcbG family)
MVKTSVSLYLESDVVEKLRRIAKKDTKSLAKVVERLINEEDKKCNSLIGSS